MSDEQEQADAVMAGLTGHATSPCPTCGVKTLSSRLYADDLEHPDQDFFCQACKLYWEVFIPEGTIRMGSDNSQHGLVPFDTQGNQRKGAWYRTTDRLRPNFVFEDTLTWVADNARSMHNFQFRRQSTGKVVAIMGTDFKKFLPLMQFGSITGKFTFRTCGGSSGVTLFKEKKPPAQRKSRAKAKGA